MNCQEANQRMTDLFDKETTPETGLVREHLANCPACRVLFEEHQQIFERVRQASRVATSHQFGAKIMNAITNAAALETAPTANFWRRQGWRRWTVVACATALLVFLLPMLPLHLGGGRSTPAFSVLAQSIEAMSDVQTIHMTGRMRTLPGDNFELIGTDYGFVPLEIWRQYNPSRWRVEKPGRTVVMDGQSAILYIGKLNAYMKAPPQAGFVEWLRPLLNPESILQSELDSAKQTPSEASVTEADGTITLTVQRKAKGSFTNSWARNKSIDDSDHTCIYKFDLATKRLQSLQVAIHVGTQDVTVLELNDIRYNEELPDSLFALQLPAGAEQIPTIDEMPPTAAPIAGPKEAAQYFFNALASEDMNAVRDVFPVNPFIMELMKKQFGGLSVLSIGEPFQSGTYPGYYVPYQVRLRDGSEQAYNLAVRNDNPQKRWTVDGGI
jgi:outer membrane lipoprotein-sorting protein